ncbi:DUF1641 domain-containing protein [Archaeoglobus neptunius]|uniref:DUF1641 domain-containing protein n=1 Tax=Archaeoglobus neptunius TaxID=2798580 RepID=UPI001928CE92|nr:DUF1641 domain-containing protein [Archaeoglobus neptunius]
MIADFETKAADVLTRMMEKLAENGDAILAAMDKLIYLERNGILDELVNFSEMVPGIRKLPEEFLDEDVQDVATKNLELILSLALSVDDEMIQQVEKLIDAFKKTREFEPAGLTGALKALRDPDVQRALGFMLAFAKNLGKSI